jgi:TPR repeat protein
MTYLGCQYANESSGLQQDWNKVLLELWTPAAELWSSNSHFSIATGYFEGWGVEKVMKKALAAMAGHEMARARHNLRCIENKYGNLERAIRHWIISASAGNSESMSVIKK